MSFNPANFPWTQPLQHAVTQAQEAPAAVLVIAGDLKAAAKRFAVRNDSFAAGKADTCLDIAAKLERFGSFASDRQRDFALKLIDWSIPRWERRDDLPQAPAPDAPKPLPPFAVPRLHDLLQRLAKLTIGPLQIVRKNGDSLCWIKHERAEKVVGRIVDGGVCTFWARPGVDLGDIREQLERIERDPEAAAVLHGKASGRCAVCSRDLTDPESIARGIGPICAEKF